MESSKVAAKELYDDLLPHEQTVLKIEDVLAFNTSIWRGIVVILLANIIYVVCWVSNFSCYSGIFLALGICLSINLWGPIVAKFLLPAQLEDEKPRFDLKEMCAAYGTVVYLIESLKNTAINGLKNLVLVDMLMSAFVLLLLFYLFISIPDSILGFLALNTVLFLPYFQLKFNKEELMKKIDGVKQKMQRKGEKKQKVE